MKKLIIIAIIISILCLNKEEKVLIPKESIRFRIIANSDTKEDQNLKNKLLTNLTSNINFSDLSKTNINLTRKNIKNTLPQFRNIIEETLKEENANPNYEINYGNNYFPRKEYKNVYYEGGYYESLVITLGKGGGQNFWCVLFPPLCLIEKEDKKSSDVEYKSFIKEVIDKYF